MKRQVLIVTVADDMEDPEYLIKAALERYLSMGPVYPEYGDDPGEVDRRSPAGYIINAGPSTPTT